MEGHQAVERGIECAGRGSTIAHGEQEACVDIDAIGGRLAARETTVFCARRRVEGRSHSRGVTVGEVPLEQHLLAWAGRLYSVRRTQSQRVEHEFGRAIE